MGARARRARRLIAGAGTAGMIAFTGVAPVAGATGAARVISNSPWQGRHGTTTSTWSSSNWSGYAKTGTFDGVSATWSVPSVSASSGSTYSSAWIGVDGYNNSDLIQTGTEEDYYSGSAHYNAWWEILPAAETPLPSGDAVSPGDQMSAEIYKTSATQTAGTRSGPGSFLGTGRFSVRNAVRPQRGGRGGGGGGGGGGSTSEPVWVISITDQTKNWNYVTDKAYSGPGTSAEWIVEAPEVNGRIATLAHYTMTATSLGGDFDAADVATTVTPSGATPSLAGAALQYTADAGTLVQSGQTVSSPSQPDGVATAFNMANSATAPTAPTS